MGLTLPDIFFYLFRQNWPLKITTGRLEYADSNSQICPNFVGPDIASIEFQFFFMIPAKNIGQLWLNGAERKKICPRRFSWEFSVMRQFLRVGAPPAHWNIETISADISRDQNVFFLQCSKIMFYPLLDMSSMHTNVFWGIGLCTLP